MPEDLHLHEEKAALLLADKIGTLQPGETICRKDGAILWVEYYGIAVWKPGDPGAT